ncbi:response regulator [Pseudomonas cavernae]|uniref:Response regulator n=1 Tax=Pseudomonas cavernae TaxID=2320867 RepID=A0A385Z5N0_9PSED|nr:HDOD domain-containing protein [Pseudomonas cavernae]AYC32978.1 response regulator [Pseudomonas cavernae]
MRVLILDNDPGVADLLKQLLLSLRSRVRVDGFTALREAVEAWQRAPYQLVLADWHLAHADGVRWLESIRRENHTTAVVVLSSRCDRASVLSARALGIRGFISKPFQVQRVMAYLADLIPPTEDEAQIRPDDASFLTYLAGLSAAELDLPLVNHVRDQLLRYLQGEQPDLRALAEGWQQDPALCARLITVANSSAYRTGGRPCLSLLEAMQRLGAQTSLNLAFGMALRRFTEQASPLLQSIIQEQLEAIERLSDHATSLARHCRLDPAPLQTAALLHRMGELYVLYLAQVWENSRGTLDDHLVPQAIGQFSRPFAVRLKAHWRLPLPLRELIGAVYGLPPTPVHQEQVVMRLAAAELYGEDSARLERLKRLAGLI